MGGTRNEQVKKQIAADCDKQLSQVRKGSIICTKQQIESTKLEVDKTEKSEIIPKYIYIYACMYVLNHRWE